MSFATEPEVVEIDDDSDASESDLDDEEFFFHCPFCNFKSKSQLGMGEHVIENHEKPEPDTGRARARGQCYKTFYGRKLRLFIIS